MIKRTKICFLQFDLSGGGAERKVCTLANYFVSQGYDVEIGLFRKNRVSYSLDRRVKVKYINRDTYEYISETEKKAYGFISGLEKAIDTVTGVFSKTIRQKIHNRFMRYYNYLLPFRRYVLNRQDSVFITMMVSVYLEVLRVMKPYWNSQITVPYLVMDCSDPKHNADAATQVKRNRTYPMAARVLVMTQGAKDCFNTDIQKKCVIIPNPVRDDLPEAYYGKRRMTVVTCCRLSKQKNLPLLIEAFKKFHQLYSDYTLEIYGNGEERESLGLLIVEKGLENCACIYPFDSQVHYRIKNCAMFVSSSDWEGFGNSLLEALALGMPVISTDCDFGPRDMITDHVNGLLVPTGDIQALANAMIEVAENPKLAEMMGNNAVKTRQIYSPEKIGTQWLELIEEVKKEYV